LDKAVDLVLSVAKVASRDEVLGDRLEATLGGVHLEGVQEPVGLGKVGADGEDLVDQVFNANNVLAAQSRLDLGIVENGGSSGLGLGESSFVDHFSDSLEVGISPSNVGLNNLQHVEGGLVDSKEDSIVDLSKSHQLEDFSRLGVDLVDTSNSNNKSEFGLRSNVVVASLSCNSLESHERFLLVSVFSNVRFSSLEDDLSIGSVLLSLFQSLFEFFNLSVFGELSSSQDAFRDSGDSGAGKGQYFILTVIEKNRNQKSCSSPTEHSRRCPMHLIGVFK
jgi:hypothetical protein